MTLGTLLLLGLGTATGLWLIAVGLRPPLPRLDRALDGPDRAAPPDFEPATPPGWATRLGRPAVHWLRRAGLPTASTRRDLATLDKPIDAHLAEQATAATLGLLLPPVAATVLTLADVHIGPTMPTIASLLLAATGLLVPELAVRTQAAAYRATFRDALSSYLDLVVVGLAAGSGVDQALDDASTVGTGPAYTELRYTLTESRHARTPPWEALAALGHRMALPELRHLAGSIGHAGTEGARVRISLRARAVSLRERQLTDAEAHANAATERMAIPVVALFAGFLIFLSYPAVAVVLTSF